MYLHWICSGCWELVFTSDCLRLKVLLPAELVEACFESLERTARLEKEATKMKVSDDVSNSGMLKACLIQSLLDSYGEKERTTRNSLFQLLVYEGLVSRSSVASDTDLREGREEIA